MPVVIRENIGWCSYTATTLLLGYGQLIRKLASDTGGTASRFGPALAATILAVGIIAALLHKPLLAQWFWKLTFAVFALASSLALLFGLYLLVFHGLHSWPVLLLLSGAIYLLPAEVLLHRYAFNSEQLWQPKSANTTSRTSP